MIKISDFTFLEPNFDILNILVILYSLQNYQFNFLKIKKRKTFMEKYLNVFSVMFILLFNQINSYVSFRYNQLRTLNQELKIKT